MNRPLRIALLAAAAVVVLIVGAGAVLLATFDPNSYKPQIIQAVKRATGRDLTLNGTISLKPSLWPTIQVADAAFSNPAGYSRPQMATLQGLELQLALLPLLSSRFEIARLVLIHPDILLETDAAGHANWQLAPEVSPSAPAGTQAPVKSGNTTTAISVESVRIKDGTLGYRDGATGKVTTLGLPNFEATAASADAPLHVDAAASYNNTALTLVADTGSLSRLQDPDATSPWPVKLALTAASATLTGDGSVTRPLQGKGYDLALTGSVPDVAALQPLLQGVSAPPLHDARFAVKVTDTGGKIPAFSALTLHVGASDLGVQVPGLTLDNLDVAAAANDQPMKANASGKLQGQPLTLAATSGPLGMLMQGAKPGAFPIDIALHVAGATISAKGSIADARAMTGANVALAAQIPDLSGLSPLARRALPAVKQIAFQGTLTDVPSGLRNGVILHSFSVTSSGGDISGDVAVSLSARNSLAAVLKSNRIDLDALQAAANPAPASGTAAPSQTAGPAPASPSRRGDRLFSDQPIPLDVLKSADADVKLNIANLHSGGADYKAVATHAVLKGGKLSVDPFVADLPAGHMAGNLTVDATQAAPPVHITLHAPGLALQSVLAAAGQPSFAKGNLEVYADLRGTGASPHAIAASLNGSLGIAMADGTIDNRLLGSILGKVLDSLAALNLVGTGGVSDLKCFGMRLDAQRGITQVKALTLSSSLLTMTGSGTMNLGDETLALELRPQTRVAGNGVVIPVNVSGPMRSPLVKLNQLGAAEANAGTVAGAALGNKTRSGIVGGLLGGASQALIGGSGDICTPALAAARGQPIPDAGGAAAGGTGLPKPAPDAVLKNLFR